MPAHAIFVDIDAKAGAVETLSVAVGDRDRLRGNVRGESDMRQRQSPIYIGNDRCNVQCGRTCDVRFSGPSRDININTIAFTQAPVFTQSTDATHLDRLQAYAAGGFVLMVPFDVLEPMNAYVDPARDVGRCRHCGHSAEIIGYH